MYKIPFGRIGLQNYNRRRISSLRSLEYRVFYHINAEYPDPAIFKVRDPDPEFFLSRALIRNPVKMTTGSSVMRFSHFLFLWFCETVTWIRIRVLWSDPDYKKRLNPDPVKVSRFKFRLESCQKQTYLSNFI